MNRFFTLLLAASCLTAVGQDFDGLTQAFTTDSSLFLTSEGYLSWDSAQAFAASIGGHLATFASTTENLEVVPSVNSNGGTGGYWFGLRQDINGAGPNEGWGWATGESLTFTNWGGSEPNNVNGIEDCGELNSNGTWNDADCEVLRRFVVEVTLHAGCADQQACNFDSQANFDDGSCVGCEVLASACGVGTVWDAETQTCIVANPSDSNFDGCVQLNDLLDLLSAYGDCGAEESAWQCGDPLEYQGYAYETVQIGEQCWFAENLRAENYGNGDAIATLAGNSDPFDSGDCDLYYSGQGLVGLYGQTWACSSNCAGSFDLCSNSEETLFTFGLLYNEYAVSDPRSLCPTGWHASTDEEWMTLEVALGMALEAAQSTGGRGQIAPLLKSDVLWCEDNSGQGSEGLELRPAGTIFDDCGASSGAWGAGYFWSVSDTGQDYYRRLEAGYDDIDRYVGNQSNMFSIRCIKDAE